MHFAWEILGVDNQVRASGEVPNGVTTAALNDRLEVYFRSGTQKANWYGSIIDNTSYSAVDPADTAASHAGWTEFTSYSELVRQAWGPDAAAGGIMANSTKMTFTISANGSIRGFFLASSSTKGGAGGVLYSTAALAAAQAVIAGEVLRIIYKVPAVPNEVVITS